MSTSVPNCHSGGDAPLPIEGSPVVALVGAPNVGKSTLFNGLTGAHRDMGNWPGTSIEVGRGRWRGAEGVEFALLDLPGAYSLDALSPDEELTRDLMSGATHQVDCVVVAVDAARLTRSLYLVAQLTELTIPVVVALTMNDVASSRGIQIDPISLGQHLGVRVVVVDPRRRLGLEDLSRNVAEALIGGPTAPRRNAGHDAFTRADDRFAFISESIEHSTVITPPSTRSWSDRLDRIALAPVLGPILFLIVMWAVFQLTTTIAAPLQGVLDAFFTGPLTDAVNVVLAAAHLKDTWVQGLIVDGIIAGVGMLLTFLPLMAIMFLLLSLLEDSGYMARAAIVTDRVMRAIGLPGRAFVPLVVGFGCNVPAIAATRVLPNARQRILTALLVPFTSCSARLTVYVLVATIFFPDHAGTVVFMMYVISIVFIVVVGLALRKTLWRTMGSEPLILDLPAYQRPTIRITAAVTWTRLRGFIKTASGIIVATVIAVWILQSIPATPDASFGNVPVQDSVYATASSAVAPIFTPAGFGEWETTSALIVGFIAKEAVISSWSQTYAVEDPTQTDNVTDLGAAISAEFEQSSGGHTSAAVWAFLVFLLAYTPCVATLATQKREIGLRWTLFGIGMQFAVAWCVAVCIFQIGSRLG